MTRTPEAVARQRRALISGALSVISRLPESRLQQLAPPTQTTAAYRSELLAIAERNPRAALMAFAKEATP